MSIFFRICFILYLGRMIDSNLNWKSQINYFTKKIKRTIGMFFKLWHYGGLKIVNLYYALVYPFSIYGIIVWGNVYPSTLKLCLLLLFQNLNIIILSCYSHVQILQSPLAFYFQCILYCCM